MVKVETLCWVSSKDWSFVVGFKRKREELNRGIECLQQWKTESRRREMSNGLLVEEREREAKGQRVLSSVTFVHKN